MLDGESAVSHAPPHADLQRLRAPLQLVVAALLFSTGGAAIKATALTGWQVAAFRSGVAALAVLLLSPAARRGWTWRAVLVGVAYASTLVLFVVANKLTTSANTIFLQSTAPLYLLVLSPFLLGEPVERRDIGFMLAVGAGLVFFFVGVEPPVRTAPDPARGNLLAALSGVTWALTVCGLRWMASKGEAGGSPVAAVVSGNLTAFFAALPMALPLDGMSVQPVDWLVVAYLGVFQIGVAYILVTSALRSVGALEASLLLLVEPALNPVWSWLMHGERPGTWALTGGAIILGSTVVRAWLDARRPAPVRPVGAAGMGEGR